MKSTLTLLVTIISPLIFGSCAPTTEYHTVRVYEYSPAKPAPKVAAPKDDPRMFEPKKRF